MINHISLSQIFLFLMRLDLPAYSEDHLRKRPRTSNIQLTVPPPNGSPTPFSPTPLEVAASAFSAFGKLLPFHFNVLPNDILPLPGGFGMQCPMTVTLPDTIDPEEAFEWDLEQMPREVRSPLSPPKTAARLR